MNVALARIAALAAGAVTGAAIGRELDKPADQREWHGDVGGVPYDFRAPTADRARHILWNPDNPKLVGPPLFGVGWSVNFARLAERISPAPPKEGPTETPTHKPAEPPTARPAETPTAKPAETPTPKPAEPPAPDGA